MKFQARVEPPEPMRGLEVPAEIVEALGGGKRPTVRITINGHSWRSRVTIMRGRHLIGLSNANRVVAGVVTGDEVEVEVEFDSEPRIVAEPADLARALDADPLARAAYNRLPYGLQLKHVRAIEAAKTPETRGRRIEKAIATATRPSWPPATAQSPLRSGQSRTGQQQRRPMPHQTTGAPLAAPDGPTDEPPPPDKTSGPSWSPKRR
jgi:Bacteriocin-protection, YdeI or OmpD-Associated/Domain of unknown function (DUF1905)